MSTVELKDEDALRFTELKALKKEYSNQHSVPPDHLAAVKYATTKMQTKNPREEPVMPIPHVFTKTQLLILEQAGRLYQEGDTAYPDQISTCIGMSGKSVSHEIKKLRDSGFWPYLSCGSGRRPPKDGKAVPPDPAYVPNHDPNADAESLVIMRIVSQLARLPTHASRNRVLAYIQNRIQEDECN